MVEFLLAKLLQLYPVALGLGGLGLVVWLSRAPRPADLRADVLAALSTIEPLPPRRILGLPPLAGRKVDVPTLTRVLDELCREGAVVRWYEALDADAGHTRRVVYRRIA
jgi:hypothetical protein